MSKVKEMKKKRLRLEAEEKYKKKKGRSKLSPNWLKKVIGESKVP